MSEITIGSVALLIAERPLCAGCICSKCGFTRSDLVTHVNGISGAIRVDEQTGRCAVCGDTTMLFSLARPVASN
jgi:hypothetical protein